MMIRSIANTFATAVHQLALKLAAILVHQLGRPPTDYFTQTCRPPSCYLRFNRYPVCPKYNGVCGIVPHTDSDFLTVLHLDDDIGGLQLLKDGQWFAVCPIPHALMINVGDLFQAWSNDEYKSVQHRVVTNGEMERFSTAYFLCPSYDTVIPSEVYHSFTYRDYRQQITDSVAMSGKKIGLPMFLRTRSTY